MLPVEDEDEDLKAERRRVMRGKTRHDLLVMKELTKVNISILLHLKHSENGMFLIIAMHLLIKYLSLQVEIRVDMFILLCNCFCFGEYVDF